jgi:aryl sulfotransferase
VLVHYDDLSEDLDGEMRRLADRLDITVAPEIWPKLVHAARFDQMRTRARDLAPDAGGTLRDPQQFFGRGTSGAGRELLGPADLARYHARATQLAPFDLLEWLHRAHDPQPRPSTRNLTGGRGPTN